MSNGTNFTGLAVVMAVFLTLGVMGDRAGVAVGPLNLLGGLTVLAADLFYRKVWRNVPLFAWGLGGWLLYMPLWVWGILWVISGAVRIVLQV